MTAAVGPDKTGDGGSVADAARWASGSERLRQRRFELLALRGEGAVVSGPQGRAPSSSSVAPAELVELISSIAEVGVLQPVLVEEVSSEAGVERRLVAGERRLRAAAWGAVHLAANPHFGALPAVVCPGPLTDEERHVWQFVENIAREDLQPGELAAALLFERCAVLASRLSDVDVVVDAAVFGLDDPVQRWDALDQVRTAEAPQVGAPWLEVLGRLGVQMRTETAARLVRALRRLPAELSADLDAHEVALASRLAYLRLDRGRDAAAREVWEAVKARGRPELLTAALRATSEGVAETPGEAVKVAEDLHEQANQARRDALAKPPSHLAALATSTADDEAGVGADEGAASAVAAETLAHMRELVGYLRDGWRPSRRYDQGSLRLYARQVIDLLGKHTDIGTTADEEPSVAGETGS